MAQLNFLDAEIQEVKDAVSTGVAEIDAKITDSIITSSLVAGSATDFVLHGALEAINVSLLTAEQQTAFANAYNDANSLTTFMNVGLSAGQLGAFRRGVLYKTASNLILYLRNLTSESGGAVSQAWENPEFPEKQAWLDKQAENEIDVLRSLYPPGVDCEDDITFAGTLGTLGLQRTGGTTGGGSTPTPTPSVDFDITGLTSGTPTATDEFAFYDTSESGLRKANIQAILDLAASQSFSISGLTSATPQVTDEIPFNDISDSNSNKKATITSILAVWATANAAQLVPTTGTTGHYLKKTTTGSEWAEVSSGGGSFDIEDLTTATPATGDFLAFHDSSGNADRKATIQTVLNLASQAVFSIDGLTAVTPALTDYIPIADASDSDANKKALISGVLGLIDESDWRVSGLTSATPTTSDMLVFSDESETGDPNRKATIATVLGLATESAFEITDLTTATPQTTDFLAFSDESATGDPNRKATISTVLALASQASFDINALTAESTPATADTIAVYDTSASAMRKVTLANIQSLIGSTFNINTLTAETSPANADTIAIYDASASAMRKVTINNLKTLIETGKKEYTYNGTSFNLRSANADPRDITYDSVNNEYLVGDTESSGGIFPTYTASWYRYNASGLYQGTRSLGTNTLTAIAFDPDNSKVFWGGTPNNIKKSNINGTVEATYNSNSSNTRNSAMAFDTNRNFLLVLDVDPSGTDYWYEYNESGVYQNRRTVNSANANPQGIAYDSANDEVLIIDDTDNAYHRYQPNGTYIGQVSVSAAVSGTVDRWLCYNSDDDSIAVLKRDNSGTDTVYIFESESAVGFNISELTAATPALTDYVALSDTSDSNTNKKALVSSLLNLLNTSEFNINALTAETAPTTSDTIAIYDTSASAMRKVTLANIETLIATDAFDINALTAETSANNADTIAIYDASASAMRKMTRANFLSGIGSSFDINTLPDFSVGRDTTKDIAASVLRSAKASIIPTGITYDGTSVLIIDNESVWGFTNGARDTSKDIAASVLQSANSSIYAQGITYDGTSVLVVDGANDAVWGFTNGARDTSKDISQSVLRSANSSISPQGIVWDGTSALVLDGENDAVWGFTNGARDTSKDISQSVLRSANSSIIPTGIAWDGTGVLVLDSQADAVWGFKKTGNTWVRDTNKDIAASVLRSANNSIHPTGITYDGENILIVDSVGDAVWGFSNSEPVTSDTIAVYDTSTSTARKVTLANIQSLIGGAGWTSAATAPSNPTDGQGWYDTATNILKIYDGTTWEPASGFDHYNNPTATAALGDWIGFADISDSNKPKKDTIQDILDLGGFATQKSLFSENKFWGINQNAAVDTAGEWVFLNASNAVVSTNDNALTSTEVSTIRYLEIHEDVFGNSDYLNAIANEDNATGFTQLQTNGGTLYIHDTDASNYGTIAGDYFTVTITSAGSSKTGSVYKFACTVTQTGSVWNGGQWYAFDFDVVSTQKLQAQQLVDVQTLFAHTLAVQNTDRLLAMNGAALGSIDTGTLLSRYVEIGDLIGDDTADFYTQFQPVAALLNALTTNRRGAWSLATNASGAPTQTDNTNYTQINDGNYTLVIAAIQQNSDWTFKSTAYTASDFSSGDILYAHPYDPYDSKNYYKMTLTANGTLVGTGNAAYIYAPVTVDEVGSVDDPSDGWRITETPPTDILSGLRGRLPIASTPELDQSSKLLLSTFNEATIAHLGKHIRPDTTAPTIIPTTFETTNANIKNQNNLVGIQNPLLNGVMALLWSIPNSVNDNDGNAVAVADIEDRLNIHHQFELYSGSKVIKGTVTNFNKVVLPGATYHQVNLQNATQAGSAFTDGESVNIEIKSGIVGRDEFSAIAFGNVLALASATPLTTDSLAFYDASNGGLRRATISTILALASGGSFSVSDTTTGTPVATDYLVFSDESVANDPNRKATIQTVLDLASASGLDINGLTAETAPTPADTLAIYDASVSANRKVTIANFVKEMQLPDFYHNSSKDLSQTLLQSAASNINTFGITWDGESVLIADNTNDAVWGFTNGARDTSKDIAASVLRSASASIVPQGITYDGASVLIADNSNKRVWGFTNGARDTTKDIAAGVIISPNHSMVLQGITWDGASVLVLDNQAKAVWGYKKTGNTWARDTSKDIAASVMLSAASNMHPLGITWDGESVLIADNTNDAVWGFTNGARDTSKDIAASVLRSADNSISASGLAYDGTNLLVSDFSNKVFAFSKNLQELLTSLL